MIVHARWALMVALWLWAGWALAGTKHYYYTDAQGTVLAKADAQGNIVASYDYAPYGTQVLGTPPSGPAGYTGHVNDAESGFVYMQQRYYDPVVGRFLSVDPAGGNVGNIFNFGRYVYVNNNPLIYIDPDGNALEPQSKGARRFIKSASEASPIIRSKFEHLDKSKNTWRVVYARLNGGKKGLQSHVDADSMHDAIKKSDGGTGKGSGGTIYINKWTEKVAVADVKNGTPRTEKISADEAASHELDHAVQNDTGTTSSDGREREHEAREAEDRYRNEQKLKGERNNVEGN